MDSSVIQINDENKNQIKDKLLKLFNKKNFKIFVLIIIGVISLILFMGFDEDKENNDTSNTSSDGYITTLEYCQMLEEKLTNVLSNVDGAGQVKVMITVDGSPEMVYATEKDETHSSNASGTTTMNNSSTPIILDVGSGSSALILTEKLPKVKGVVVVSTGAGNVAIKLNILNAVSTLLNIDTDKISVLKGI